MNKTERFSIYEHRFVYANNLIITKQFIVLKHIDGTMTFTNFHKYIKNPDKKIKSFNEKNDVKSKYICKFLNYAFFTANIDSLSKLTVDIGRDFLNAYGMHELSDDDEYVHRNKDTVKKCVSAVLHFYINLIEDKSTKRRIKTDDLFKNITTRDKYGKAFKKRVLLFDVSFIPNHKEPIFRDMPNKAFILLFDHIAINHTELLGLVMHQAFAGLRPSEACNVRRMDSPLGAGIRIREVNGKLCGVTIDLRDELNLRSDLLSVGNIKKERIAKVPDIFLSAYKDTYEIYMAYMENKPYEVEYGVFSVNKQGRAITYDSYYSKFKEIIKNEMIPIYLNSNDNELVLYGQTLMEHSLSPHVFRHWFTVQLVLSGINEPGTLMAFRGDTSPESALTYINNKGELEKQFSKITNETFDYTLWAAKKKHNEGI